jgi:hypothetical protein
MLARRAALASLLLAVAPARADDPAPAEPSRFLEIHAYEPDGPFVTVPARTFGMITLILAGGSAAILCTPIDLVRGVVRREGFGEITEACGSQVGQSAASVAYITAGAPFWLLKRGFWDGPRTLLGYGAPSPDRVQPDVG